MGYGLGAELKPEHANLFHITINTLIMQCRQIFRAQFTMKIHQHRYTGERRKPLSQIPEI
jgi:hypothetical protein